MTMMGGRFADYDEYRDAFQEDDEVTEPTKYVVLTVDGNAKIVDRGSNDDLLAFLQGHVGGLVECLPSPWGDDIDVWINEEGKYQTSLCQACDLSVLAEAQALVGNGEHYEVAICPECNGSGFVSGLPRNEVATRFMDHAGLLFVGDWIAGTVVLASMDEDGNILGLTTDQLREIGSTLAACGAIPV